METLLIVSTDASGEGVGAELWQKQVDEDGNETPRTIALASMAFSKAQKKYSAVERELAGIRWGIGGGPEGDGRAVWRGMEKERIESQCR